MKKNRYSCSNNPSHPLSVPCYVESLSELHYTAPDIYDRKIKAVSTTFPRNRGQITDVMDYLKRNMDGT